MNLDFSDSLFIISGAGGFLGTRLVKELYRCKAAVAANSLEYLEGVEWYGKNSEDRVLCTVGPFHERSQELSSFIKCQSRPKIICFHMAGMSHAGECEKMPGKAFEANVTTTSQVLQFCKENGVTEFIFPSTCHVYDDNGRHPKKETAALNPKSYYAITKLVAEELVKRFCQVYALKGKVIRFSNIYGTGSHPDTVINTILAQIKTGNNVRVKDVGPVCDFIHLKDAVEGLLRVVLLEGDSACEVFNISSGYGVSIKDLIAMAYQAGGIQPREQDEPISPSISKSHLVLDNQKLYMLAEWRPSITLSAGLKRVLTPENR